MGEATSGDGRDLGVASDTSLKEVGVTGVGLVTLISGALLCSLIGMFLIGSWSMLLSCMKDFELSSSTFFTIILGDRGGNLGDSGPSSETSSSVCLMTETLRTWCIVEKEWVSVGIDLPSSDILEDSEDG